jgi:hypothetical protein
MPLVPSQEPFLLSSSGMSSLCHHAPDTAPGNCHLWSHESKSCLLVESFSCKACHRNWNTNKHTAWGTVIFPLWVGLIIRKGKMLLHLGGPKDAVTTQQPSNSPWWPVFSSMSSHKEQLEQNKSTFLFQSVCVCVCVCVCEWVGGWVSTHLPWQACVDQRTIVRACSLFSPCGLIPEVKFRSSGATASLDLLSLLDSKNLS